jgi:hypothetical protein
MNMGIVTTTPVSLLRNSEDRLFTTDFLTLRMLPYGFFIVSSVASTAAAMLNLVKQFN